jgi:hypothetical protein
MSVDMVHVHNFKAVFTSAKVGTIMPATMTYNSDTLVLALTTFGGETKNRNIPICIALPKVAKARTVVTVVCCCP